MALSYYSNWGAFQQLNSENMNGFVPAAPMEELTPEALMNDFSFAFQEDNNNNNIDHLFEQQPISEEDSFFFDSPPETCNSLLPNFLSAGVNYGCFPSDNYICDNIPSEPIFEIDEPFNYPKRFKTFNDNYEEITYVSDKKIEPFPLNGFFPNNPPYSLTFHDYYRSPNPEFVSPSSSDFLIVNKLQTSNGRTLSTQSIAARQRRRKITEKTQELGKMIPGGHKMNTAEMFQAAYKYIKFLQAQVGILESMPPGSTHYQEDSTERILSEEIQDLVESPLVQEKLYSAEKCLVPQRLVHELSRDEKMLKSKPQLLKDVKQLLETTKN